MKIKYEVGDVVRLQDTLSVPHGLAWCLVRLKRFNSKSKKWIVEVTEADYLDDSVYDSVYEVSKKWFEPPRFL
tara:strand:+ start:129 stop:347 length:219 start_codon:yes stop_codon:yes gene_type:complete